MFQNIIQYSSITKCGTNVFKGFGSICHVNGTIGLENTNISHSKVNEGSSYSLLGTNANSCVSKSIFFNCRDDSYTGDETGSANIGFFTNQFLIEISLFQNISKISVITVFRSNDEMCPIFYDKEIITSYTSKKNDIDYKSLIKYSIHIMHAKKLNSHSNSTKKSNLSSFKKKLRKKKLNFWSLD